METKKESEVSEPKDDGVMLRWGPAEDEANGVVVNTYFIERFMFGGPVAFTAAVWNRCIVVPQDVRSQTLEDRLWEILVMTYHAMARRPDGKVVDVKLYVRDADNKPPRLVELKALCERSNGAWIMRIMLPEEN